MRCSPLIVGLLTLALAACATAPRPKSGALPIPAASPSAAGSATRADARTRVVASATAMIGQPYRWGGAAPGGFDCSGLVVYATTSAGLHLPRTAREQMSAGAPIARNVMQAGDLVFMHLAHKELHVGIALDTGRFVHAPSAGGSVRVDSLDAAPYARGFIEARRVIADAATASAR